jgi:hypothetical protein
MRYTKLTLSALVIVTAFVWSCQSGNKEANTTNEPLVKTSITKDELVKRGQILVTVGGCDDCHSPKNFGPHGPVIDSSKRMSGHPANMPTPPVIASALKPGGWILMGPDITSFVGPWGISYPANLTPDSATGIGAWTETQFIQTMRTGRHLGLEGGRPIVPPMPWEAIGKLPDDELKAIFAYLQSQPAISNRVPGPVPPDKVVAK